jgi:hypothetical protein
MGRTPKAPRTINRKSDLLRISGEEVGPNYAYEPALPRESAQPRHYLVRRILGEKKKKGRTQYLIDWFPSYVPAAYMKDAKKELKEWEAFKRSEDSLKLVFNYGDQTLLRDDVESANNSEQMQRLMFETVLEMVKKELGITIDVKGRTTRVSRAEELFSDTEWRFSVGNKEKALKIAKSTGDRKIMPAVLLINTYLQCLTHLQEGANDINEMDLPYGKIKLKYTGQLDSVMRKDQNITIRRDLSIIDILEPIFFSIFENMNAEKFTDEGCYNNAKMLRHRLRHVCKFAPFLLQRPWILFLTRIFVPSDNLVPLLQDGPHIKVKEDWPDRSRDIMMHMYRDENDTREYRAPHDIQETYLHLRDLFEEILKPEKDGGRDGEGERLDDDAEVSEADGGYDEHVAVEDRMDVDNAEHSE